MSAIYVQKGDKRTGPFTESELERLVENGEFSGQDTFWVEGMEEWLPLSTVIEMVPMEEPAAASVAGEPPPAETAKTAAAEPAPPALPGEPPPSEAEKAAAPKAPELAPPPAEPAPPAEAPKAPPPEAARPIPPPPLPQEAPVAKVEPAVEPPAPPPVAAAEPKTAVDSPIPAPPLIAARESSAPPAEASPAPPAAKEPAANLEPSEKGILFERDGVLVTREDLEIDGETFAMSTILRTETHVEHVRRFGSVFGSIVLGVVIVCVALVPFPRTTLTHWMMWGMILGALVIWWGRCLYSALRSARSHVDVIFRDGTERVISTNPGDAKKLSAAIDDALVVPQAA